MANQKRSIFAWCTAASAVLVLFASIAPLSNGAQAAPPLALSHIGAGGFVGIGPGLADGVEFRFDASADAGSGAPAAAGPLTTDSSVSSAPPGLLGEAGLNHHDNRTADGGNNFSVEPPDQGLCVGNGYVLEAVNLVTGLRDAATNMPIPNTITGLNTFFGLPFSIKRPAPFVFGPFLSDPKCVYDSDTKRFYVTVLEIDTDPATGALLNASSVLIAVSKTNNPLHGFEVFKLVTTDDGSNGVKNPGCPCFGDQPLIGLDKNGLFITTNEFSLHPYGAVFNGAQIYGISKQKLASAASGSSNALPPVAYVNAGALPTPDVGGIWYSVEPAVTPPNNPGNAGNDNKMKGIEYFLSALDFFGVLDNRVALWALTNTNSLQDAVPDVGVSVTTITTSTPYVGPPNSVQKVKFPLPSRITISTAVTTACSRL